MIWPFRKDTSVRARLKEKLFQAEHDMHDHATSAAYFQVLADLNENQQIADRHRALHEMNAKLVDRYRAELDLIAARAGVKAAPSAAPAPPAVDVVYDPPPAAASRLRVARS